MVNVEKIRVTSAAELGAIAITTADMIVIVDRNAIIANGSCPMPANPIDGQIFQMTIRLDITSLTMDFGTKTNYSSVTKILGGTSVGWIFDTASNGWFAYGNPIGNPSDLQSTLSNKLAANGDGSALTGLTKTQVSLSNVDNTSDANKPVSSATTTALNLKAPLANPTFTGTVAGVTATMVGLGSVNNTADSAKPVSTAQQTALDAKQASLVSGTNIKTVNGGSLLGSGDISLVGVATYSRVTGSNATTTGQSLVDIAGLNAALVANAVYEFEAIMSCTTSAVTTGTAYGVNFSAAGATVEANIVAASSTTATKAERVNVLNTATTTFLATSGQAGGVNIRGIMTTGANAGNLTIKHLKVSSGTSTILINSYLKTTRIS